ncbi:Rieske (2Fe-2S) protein [Arenicellales bacterium nBUS_45]
MHPQGARAGLESREFFDLDGKNLICATHGALYSPNNGECLGGPCSGTALTQIQVVEEQGDVFLTDHRYHIRQI